MFDRFLALSRVVATLSESMYAVAEVAPRLDRFGCAGW